MSIVHGGWKHFIRPTSLYQLGHWEGSLCSRRFKRARYHRYDHAVSHWSQTESKIEIRSKLEDKII
jgi:hypothetical protein